MPAISLSKSRILSVIAQPQKGMFEILQQYSHLVEPVSIDEGYVDITESYELGSPLEIAHHNSKADYLANLIYHAVLALRQIAFWQKPPLI